MVPVLMYNCVYKRIQKCRKERENSRDVSGFLLLMKPVLSSTYSQHLSSSVQVPLKGNIKDFDRKTEKNGIKENRADFLKYNLGVDLCSHFSSTFSTNADTHMQYNIDIYPCYSWMVLHQCDPPTCGKNNWKTLIRIYFN